MAVFWLSLRQLTGRFRMGLILLLAALPVVLAFIVYFAATDDESFDENFIDILLDGLLVAGIMPIVTMALATAAFGNELEDGTLSNLMLKPLPRWRIALPKLFASVAISGPLVIASGVAATLVGFSVDFETALAVGVALLLGVAAYAAIFTWTGLVTTRSLAFALIYVLLWEGIIGSFIDGVSYLSVRGYTLAIMYGIDKTAFAPIEDRVIEFPVAIAGAVIVTVAFLLLGVRRLRRMDVS